MLFQRFALPDEPAHWSIEVVENEIFTRFSHEELLDGTIRRQHECERFIFWRKGCEDDKGALQLLMFADGATELEAFVRVVVMVVPLEKRAVIEFLPEEE